MKDFSKIEEMIAARDSATSSPEVPRETTPVFETRSTVESRKFDTGSVRGSRAGKGRFDLIPSAPYKRLAQLYERGAEVYGDRNWEKGQNLSSYLDSLERHLCEFKSGDRVEDHLISVVWNAFAFLETERRIKNGQLPAELNDLEKETV